MVDLKYRPDIDGLRAVAVCAVIGFHAFPEWIQAGFIGVDIFFVLSGFLITGILIRQVQAEPSPSFGAFIRHFYARRILRIFPALIVMLSISYVVARSVLWADEFKQFSKHVAAGAGFVSNFVLWRETGYFDTAAETKPLLHLWSLGVEEQFYLLWPLMLWGMWKKQIRLGAVTFVLIGTSLLLMTISVWHGDMSRAFFSPQSRMWELLAGAALAFTKTHHFFGYQITQRWRNWIANLSGCLLLLMIALFPKANAWPSLWTLVPCIAVLNLLWTGGVGSNGTWLSRRVLSGRWLVAIGLISYPLYLWHWPLLSFVRIIEGGASSFTMRMAVIGLSFLFAYLTYMLIEKPVRYGDWWGRKLRSQSRQGYRLKIAVLCGVLFLCAAVGLATRVFNVLWLSPPLLANANVVPLIDSDAACRTAYPDFVKFNFCKLSDSARQPTAILLGDSHAGYSYPAYAQFFTEIDGVLLNLGNNATVPFYRLQSDRRDYTAELMNQALDIAKLTPSIQTVILAHFVAPNATPNEYDLRATLSRFGTSQKRVIYIVDTPSMEFPPSECLPPRFFLPKWLNPRAARDPCAIKRVEFDKKYAPYHAMIARLKIDFPKINFFPAWQAFCDREWCWAVKDEMRLFHDEHHLSTAGALQLGEFYASWWNRAFSD